ncbi:hypothetical protein [Streptomyces sp. DH24]|uniref:hypothetical protein n=1 Tax=Streptomyces sp. DH24 TaxID=3040123 RepID=UPI002443253A|nr:hypothetical protein [Streptomyces sp. DH24]MDG9718338.1 hypothetical protein [Streptomyces sp. DH24]
MKKRSMLAIASLAAGFVVAAVTPSHAKAHSALGDLDVDRTLGTAQDLVASDSLDGVEDTLGGNG